MKKTTLLFYFAVLSLFVSPLFAEAKDEIHYGTLKSQYGDSLLLEYKGPSGTEYHTCTVLNDCKKNGSKLPSLFPKVMNSTTYEKSPDGTLGVKQMPVGNIKYYFLYDISGKKAKKKDLISYTSTADKIFFAKNNTAVIFQKGNTFTRYDIASKKTESLTISQSLSFLQISPNGSYVTGYNYATLTHELWRFSDGKKLVTPSSMQSYLEMSGDESKLAFLEDVKGFRTLFTMETNDLGSASPKSLKQVTKPSTETEDYLFVDDTLFYMANVEGPLEWDIYSYLNGSSKQIDTDVSYGDYMKLVRTKGGNMLAYLKVNGKNANLNLYAPKTGKKTEIKPLKDSKVSSNITREVKKYGGRTGVLISPKKVTKDAGLFIWMHGGPMRQVAKGFHPYLSYAVYDELLERLAEAGNYVYKIDYTGSTGYGATFRKGLDMKIGTVEIDEVEKAITEIQKEKKISNVYLIGNSYGGYMAMRGLVAYPKLLSGVISINGVSDWYGLIQQIPSSPFRELFDGIPDLANLDTYLKASVFSGMEKLTDDDKVLVVWGEQDSTVPVWQSTKYVDYAKEMNVNVSTLSFPKEDHIIRERKNLDSLCKTIVSDFDLKGVACRL